jgi:hypothetical protein
MPDSDWWKKVAEERDAALKRKDLPAPASIAERC